MTNPQIIMVILLGIEFFHTTLSTLTDKSSYDIFTSMGAAAIKIGIIYTVLNYGNFWN